MELTESLGEHFLWVDCLCTIPDDSMKYTQLHQIDLIYSHALMAIVALAGDSATTGLPGVRSGTRHNASDFEAIHGLRCIARLPLIEDILRNSAHYTRG
jgi:Heterokaryon incompatibility protein (HET)